MNYKAWAAALSVVLLCSAGVASEADARVPAAVIAQAQMSMMLDGTIDVEADGRVSALRIDGEADYPAGVVAHVHQVVQGWEFEPVLRDGQPVAFTTPMSIRLVASQIGDGGYEIRIASTRFGEHDPEDRSRVRTLAMTPPRYPEQAYRAGVTGTVYLAVQVGRDGQVLDVAAEQVDLTSAGTERVMAQARELLARTSTQAARRWRFLAPEQGEAAQAQSWNLRVPVSFQLSDTGRREDKRGRWLPYIPGPRLFVPFLRKDDDGFSTALQEGQIEMIGRPGPRLKTPLAS